MSLELHNLSSTSTGKPAKRIGRGGKRGTYSGKGQKGQRSRSGGKRGLQRRALKTLMTQAHKLRGFKSLNTKPETVSLSALNAAFEDGATVTPASLLNKGLVKTTTHGVKILGNGSISKKITVKHCKMSESAREALGQ